MTRWRCSSWSTTSASLCSSTARRRTPILSSAISMPTKSASLTTSSIASSSSSWYASSHSGAQHQPQEKCIGPQTVEQVHREPVRSQTQLQPVDLHALPWALQILRYLEGVTRFHDGNIYGPGHDAIGAIIELPAPWLVARVSAVNTAREGTKTQE